jgi:hypothetical protein
MYVCDKLSRRKTTVPITVVKTALLPFQDSEKEDKCWMVVPLLHTMLNGRNCV